MREANQLPVDLGARVREFHCAIIRLVSDLPKAGAIGVLSMQLLRSVGSFEARSSVVVRSPTVREDVDTLRVCANELKETTHWLRCLLECGPSVSPAVEALLKESSELSGILVKMVNTHHP